LLLFTERLARIPRYTPGQSVNRLDSTGTLVMDYLIARVLFVAIPNALGLGGDAVIGMHVDSTAGHLSHDT
jgi:hypothetical protein